MKKLLFAVCVAALFGANNANAQELSDSMRLRMLVDSLNKTFQWQTGKIDLSNGMASLQTPAGFRYLNAEQSERVLVDLWGNPPGQSSLGMLFPDHYGPLDADCYAFNIRFEEIGYVKDGDADDINYNELLTNMKKEAEEANPERVKMGYPSVSIIGWASSPYYDKNKKTLHWAKEIQFGEAPDGNTLNYDVRALGRKGVLSLNAIGGMAQLEEIKAKIPSVIDGISFNEGHRYWDFDSNIDNVAAWTIGGLVAGKVLTKVGFFALLVKFLKPLLLLLVAGGGAIWRYISGRRKQEDETLEPANDAAANMPANEGSKPEEPVS